MIHPHYTRLHTPEDSDLQEILTMASSNDDHGLAGRVALVTGGGSGIGRATALRFARAGASVVVSDVSSEGGEETVRLIADSGGEATFIPADVSDGEQVAALVSATIEHYGRLDCAHNNGGIEGPLSTVVDLGEADWDRVIDVNLKGVWWCLKYEIPAMLDQGGGAIVNTASVSGLKGFPPLLPAYVASKFGVVGLTAVAARHFAGQGIRINAICPGAIDTPMLDRIGAGAERLGVSLVAENPAGRLGSPAEVAEAVVWLCSDAASFITGQTLTIDGGFLA
jgi:NAD(P)-dependent dehydrogenase (short-subunit alcohol dehydrogenase family)